MVDVVTAVFGAILGGTLALVVIGLLIAGIARVALGALRGETGGVAADDVRLIQDLHRGLARMEARVETLETLLLERGERVEGSSRRNP